MAHDGRGRRRGGASAASTANTDTLRFPLAGTRGEGRAASKSPARTWELVFPLTVFAVHWLIVQLAASLAYRFGSQNSPSPPYATMPPPLGGLSHVVVEPLRQWDGLWYKLIAEQGYGGEGPHKAAFWPLYPWLMELGHRLTGWSVDTVGYLASNAAFAVALVLLYRLVGLDFDRAMARRTLWALALFPTSLFFHAVYTESLFLLLVVGALLAARQGEWWIAGCVGVLAGMTRSYGVLLILPFAVLFLQQYRLEFRRWFPAALFVLMPALGALVFAWHLRDVVDDPLAFVTTQSGWDRYQSSPWDTLRCAITSCPPWFVDGADWNWLTTLAADPSWTTLTSHEFRLAAADSDTLELVSTLLFLTLAVLGLRALPAYYSAYLIPGLLIPLYQPSEVHALMSIPRFGLTLFPLFVMLALLFANRRIAMPVAILSAILLAALTAQFALWYWVS